MGSNSSKIVAYMTLPSTTIAQCARSVPVAFRRSPIVSNRRKARGYRSWSVAFTPESPLFKPIFRERV